jgi:hypothetical protein
MLDEDRSLNPAVASLRREVSQKVAMATTTPDRPDVGTVGIPPHLLQRLEALEREVPILRAELREVRARLDVMSSGPRDAADAAVVPALAQAFGSKGFTSREVVTRSRTDLDLAAALDRACVQGAREAGWLLRALHGRDFAGFRLELRKDRRSGHIWGVAVSAD